MDSYKHFTLRFWLIFLFSVSTFLIVLSCGAGIYLVVKQVITDDILDINRAYSEKMAQTTDLMFLSMKKNLETSAGEIAPLLEDRQRLQQHLKLLQESTLFFNSILVANSKGKILATEPRMEVDGRFLMSSGAREALEKKTTVVSQPYKAITGRLIVLVSTPLWDENGNYAGFLGGTFYLEQDNTLHEFLGKHFYEDGSYLYVVDQNGTLIYHPEEERIGQMVDGNSVVQKLMDQKSGAERVVNTQGVPMLTGYAYVPSANWGIVSQTPEEEALAPTLKVVLDMFGYISPFFILLLLISFSLTQKMVNPLRQLANYAKSVRTAGTEVQPFPTIPTWYYEAEQINHAFQQYAETLRHKMNVIKRESLTDPLTGLANRRYIENTLRQWTETKKQFSVLLLDVDGFKKVNDEFGHQTGDEVLRFLSQAMKQHVRKGDICGRYGGEEFIVLLPETSAETAYLMAESLRMFMSDTVSPTGEPVTISLGVGTIAPQIDTKTLLALTDEAMYKAKQEGRNRTKLMRTIV
ncbi:sensor domain-containing diguanylate cyclase [Brevibacillus borstelensis]|uniref:sensor domain-containing diguanylate cyclase n=1 Tax=Brevibacillus borstelensis TaxID=45462 RepID=UPI002E1F8976|nr:sensor domain-containing diguanylate cyclase [Brevibacillus borstelensis]MED1873562.1 sensor domain-containing diguanylate cyclase [Brevibacillus borstelensis]